MEIIPRNPARNIPKRKQTQEEKKFWTMKQVAAIVESCPSAKYRLLWAFMAYEGLRVHEALKMRREDIRDGKLHVIGKGSKYAALPLSPPMREELDRAGVNIKTVQRLMRHATIAITLDTYSHLMAEDLESGIGQLAKK